MQASCLGRTQSPLAFLLVRTQFDSPEATEGSCMNLLLMFCQIIVQLETALVGDKLKGNSHGWGRMDISLKQRPGKQVMHLIEENGVMPQL